MNFLKIFIFLLNLSLVLVDKGNRKTLKKLSAKDFRWFFPPLLISALLDLDYSLIAYK